MDPIVSAVKNISVEEYDEIDIDKDVPEHNQTELPLSNASATAEEIKRHVEEQIELGPTFEESLAQDPTWQQPDHQLVSEMVDLLDKYFSDENLMKDKFLLKHVRRNRAGFVSVKLLTSFKKLKYLSKTDWRVTAWAIRHSNNLILNHQGTKVRRKNPIPQIDLPTTSIKTLLVKLPDMIDENSNNAPDCYTIDEVSQKFRGFGQLNTVRLIRPGRDLPQDLRNHTTKHPELGQSTCAVIEFERTDECQLAYRVLSRHIRTLKAANEPKPEIKEDCGMGDGMGIKEADRRRTCPTDDDCSEDDTVTVAGTDQRQSRLTLPDSVKITDLEGWQVSLLGSGRNPRRQAKKNPGTEVGSGSWDRSTSPRRYMGPPGNQSSHNQGGYHSPNSSPYGSRSSSPARMTTPNHQYHSGNTKLKIINAPGHSPQIDRRRNTSAVQHKQSYAATAHKNNKSIHVNTSPLVLNPPRTNEELAQTQQYVIDARNQSQLWSAGPQQIQNPAQISPTGGRLVSPTSGNLISPTGHHDPRTDPRVIPRRHPSAPTSINSQMQQQQLATSPYESLQQNNMYSIGSTPPVQQIYQNEYHDTQQHSFQPYEPYGQSPDPNQLQNIMPPSFPSQRYSQPVIGSSPIDALQQQAYIPITQTQPQTIIASSPPQMLLGSPHGQMYTQPMTINLGTSPGMPPGHIQVGIPIGSASTAALVGSPLGAGYALDTPPTMSIGSPHMLASSQGNQVHHPNMIYTQGPLHTVQDIQQIQQQQLQNLANMQHSPQQFTQQDSAYQQINHQTYHQPR